MRTKLFFRSSSGNDYEVTVEHDAITHIPDLVIEDQNGSIHDTTSYSVWNSLAEMTQELKAEIVSWGSDIGD